MVGGGFMDEYGNLQEWVVRGVMSGDKVKKRVLYGVSELINVGQFIIEELNRFGKEIFQQ